MALARGARPQEAQGLSVACVPLSPWVSCGAGPPLRRRLRPPVTVTRLLARSAAGLVGRRDAAPSSVRDRALVVLRDDAHQAYAVAPPAHLAATTGPVTP